MTHCLQEGSRRKVFSLWTHSGRTDLGSILVANEQAPFNTLRLRESVRFASGYGQWATDTTGPGLQRICSRDGCCVLSGKRWHSFMHSRESRQLYNLHLVQGWLLRWTSFCRLVWSGCWFLSIFPCYQPVQTWFRGLGGGGELEEDGTQWWRALLDPQHWKVHFNYKQKA